MAFRSVSNRLLPEIVALLVGERVRLVDEQNAAKGAFNDLRRFDGRLTHKAGHEPRPVHFHEMTLGQDADGAVKLGEDTGNRRLTGARICP